MFDEVLDLDCLGAMKVSIDLVLVEGFDFDFQFVECFL